MIFLMKKKKKKNKKFVNLLMVTTGKKSNYQKITHKNKINKTYYTSELWLMLKIKY